MPELLTPIPPADALGETGVARLLAIAAAEMRRLWQAAVDEGNFAETARWIDAAQAVHRALIAVDAPRVG